MLTISQNDYCAHIRDEEAKKIREVKYFRWVTRLVICSQGWNTANSKATTFLQPRATLTLRLTKLFYGKVGLAVTWKDDQDGKK